MKKSILYASGKRAGEVQDRYSYLVKRLREIRTGEKLYLKSWTRSKGRNVLIDNEYDNMITVLEFYNIKYVKGNDAPRGGATGDYLQIIIDKRNKFWKKSIEDILAGK